LPEAATVQALQSIPSCRTRYDSEIYIRSIYHNQHARLPVPAANHCKRSRIAPACRPPAWP